MAEWVGNANDTVKKLINEAVEETKSAVSDFLIEQIEWFEEQVSHLSGTVSVKLTANANTVIGVAFTNAQTVDGLLGPSSSMGISGGAIWSIGGDLISFEDMSDVSGDIDGFQITGGVGLGFDIHLIESYTHELGRWNIYEVIKEKLRKFGEKGGCE